MRARREKSRARGGGRRSRRGGRRLPNVSLLGERPPPGGPARRTARSARGAGVRHGAVQRRFLPLTGERGALGRGGWPRPWPQCVLRMARVWGCRGGGLCVWEAACPANVCGGRGGREPWRVDQRASEGGGGGAIRPCGGVQVPPASPTDTDTARVAPQRALAPGSGHASPPPLHGPCPYTPLYSALERHRHPPRLDPTVPFPLQPPLYPASCPHRPRTAPPAGMPRGFLSSAGAMGPTAVAPARRRRALMGRGTVALLAGLYTPMAPRVPLSAAASRLLPYAAGEGWWPPGTPPASPGADTPTDTAASTVANTDAAAAVKPMPDDAAPSPLPPLPRPLFPSMGSSPRLPPPLPRPRPPISPPAATSPWTPAERSPGWGAAPPTNVATSPVSLPTRGWVPPRAPARTMELSAAASAVAEAADPTTRRRPLERPAGGQVVLPAPRRAALRSGGGRGGLGDGRSGVDHVWGAGNDSLLPTPPARPLPFHGEGARVVAAAVPTDRSPSPPPRSPPARGGARDGAQSPLPYTLIEEAASSPTPASPSWYPLSAARRGGGGGGVDISTASGVGPVATTGNGTGPSASPLPAWMPSPRPRPGRRLFRCTYPGCASVARFRSNAKTHARLHTTETPFVCGVAGCGRRFKWASSMSYHRKQHAKGVAAAAAAAAAATAAASASAVVGEGGAGKGGGRGKTTWGGPPK